MAASNVVELNARTASAGSLSLALPLCVVGIAGLLRDSWPGAPHLAGVNLHAIFGLMLWVMVVAQYRDANLGGVPLAAAGVHELRRRLSRRIYLSLYVLFGISLAVRLAAVFWNGAQGASHPAMVAPPENLRDYLAYGVVALLTIHILAAAQCQTLRRVMAR